MMMDRRYLCGSLAFLIAVVVTLTVVHNGKSIKELRVPWAKAPVVTNNSEATKTRDSLSRLANKIRHQAALQSCELAKLRKKAFNTSDTGAFCSNSMQAHMTDYPLIKPLVDLFEGMRVGSFGDGMGVYKKEILKSGRVAVYDAYDGNPYCENFTKGSVKFMDLGIPQYGLPPYDWIVSLEVGEHIPKQYETIYIDNLTRHAKKGIVLSWAPPGQGGYGHVNNRPLKYIINLLDVRGFRLDEARSTTLKKAATFGWFKNNILVLYRK